jgi:signal transduction histidine kinase
MIIGISIPSFIVIMGGLLTYGYINDTQIRQGYVQIADDLKEHVLEVRRNEKNYFHFKNTRYFDNLHNAILVLNSSINNIGPEIIKEIGEEDISIIQSSIKKHLDLTNVLYENYQNEAEITENVRAEGRKLEAFTLKGKHAEEITVSFILHLRLIEKNYMLFRDNKSFAELNSVISKIKNVTPLCYQCTPYIEAMNNLFANYDISDSLVNEIQINGNQMEKITGKIAVRERERIGTFFAKTKYFLIIFLILLCILGPLFVYKTSGYIVAPVKRLVDITKKIADGDTSLRAPLLEHDETYSLAESFNTMLDQLNLTHHSLEKSLQLLHEKQSQLVESEKHASIGLLVSGVAHELNNPLNNVSLAAENLIESQAELNLDELNDGLHDILSQSYRARDIVENLLDFARARRSTDMEKLDINEVVKGSIKLVNNQIVVSNVKLDQDIPDSALYVKGNLSKLEQIFVNIIINAVQAMKKKDTLTIKVRPDSENKKISVIIRDTGRGISEEDLKHIFEPFFTTKEVGKGTGLGLSVSHGLVREHKGGIKVESKVGIGTTFIIELPVYKEADESK